MNFALDINFIEAIWIALNLTTFAVTFFAFLDARAAQEATRLLNGKARELAAGGIVRREAFGVVSSLVLLALALPAILVHGVNAELSLSVGLLMAIAIINLFSSLTNTRDRRAMTIMTAADILIERADAFARIEAQNETLVKAINANIEITQQASDHADEASREAKAAFKEANNVNVKIEDLNTALLAQGADQAAQRAERALSEDAAVATIEDTHDKVVDIHDALPPTTQGPPSIRPNWSRRRK